MTLLFFLFKAWKTEAEIPEKAAKEAHEKAWQGI